MSDTMIDYQTKRFTTRQVAIAAALEPATLRSLFSRKRFRVIGETGVPGVATLFSLRDALHIAVAARLMKISILPEKAFELATLFAHTGDEFRAEGELFDVREHGLTYFVHWPDREKSRIVAGDDIKSMTDLQWSPNVPDYAFQIVQLNQLENQVFTSLGVDRRP